MPLRWIVPEGAVLFPLDARLGGPGAAPRDASHRLGRRASSEREPGVASVSAPVAGSGETIIAAVSVSGPIERLSQQPGERFGDAVIAAAAELSRALVT